jgi:hypothetical protein
MTTVSLDYVIEDGRAAITVTPPGARIAYDSAQARRLVAWLEDVLDRLDPLAPPVEEIGIIVSFEAGKVVVAFPRKRLMLNAIQIRALIERIDGFILKDYEHGTELPDGTLVVISGPDQRVMKPGLVRLPPSFEELVQGYRDARAAGCRNREEDDAFLIEKWGEDVFRAIPLADRDAAFKQAAEGQKSRRGQPKKKPLPRIK